MKQYLISKGVPESAVLTEERSTSTYSNLNNSKQILDDYFETEYTVVIVTNKYHTFRAARIAQKTGMKFNILCANTPSAEIPLRYLRECASICKYCFITMLEFFKVHKYAQLPIFSWAQIFTLLLFYSWWCPQVLDNLAIKWRPHKSSSCFNLFQSCMDFWYSPL